MTIYIMIIANSLQAQVVESFCKTKTINKESIILVPLRPLRWSLGQMHLHKHLNGRLIRLVWRYLGISINTLLLQIRIQLKKKKFIILAPWHNEYVESLSSKSNCVGVYYCEEGDLSYWSENVMFNTAVNHKDYSLDRRRGPARRWLFDKNCLGFICTSENCFPSARKALKQIVKIESRTYQNVASEGDTIGVMPAAARILNFKVIDLLREYKKKAPHEELKYVKLHPSFVAYPNLELELKQALKNPEFGSTEIMDHNVDLELEVLANRLILIGLESSVERYAIQNGSIYIKVNSLLSLQAGR